MTDHDVAVATPSSENDSDRPERSIAEQLVEQARTDGVDLVGPGGLLSSLTKQVLETGLEVEMEEHLGYEKHAAEGRNGENSRNGTRSKTVITEVGPVDLDVPRDRDGSFEPKTVKKRQRRPDGVDSMVISLTAKGLTTGEVEAHLMEVYSTEISRETISKITDHAVSRLDELHDVWGTKYPAIKGLWSNAWPEFVPFLDYSPEIRRVIYSTDVIVNQVPLVSGVANARRGPRMRVLVVRRVLSRHLVAA